MTQPDSVNDSDLIWDQLISLLAEGLADSGVVPAELLAGMAASGEGAAETSAEPNA